jgi:hypothetical protein
MRKASLLACAVLFIASVSFAQTPSRVPLTEEALAAILGPVTAAASCGAQQDSQALAAGSLQFLEKSTCTANCLGSGTVTCSGSSCSARNGTCASLTGSVTCGGTTKYCGTPSYCTRCNVCGDCYSCCRCGGSSDAFCRANC